MTRRMLYLFLVVRLDSVQYKYRQLHLVVTDMLLVMSSLSCLIVVGLCLDTVEFEGEAARLVGRQSKRVKGLD